MESIEQSLLDFKESLPFKGTVEFGKDIIPTEGRLRHALNFMKKYSIPSQVACQLSNDSARQRFFVRHGKLQKVISELPSNHNMNIGGYEVDFRPMFVNAGRGSKATARRNNLLSLLDLLCCLYFPRNDWEESEVARVFKFPGPDPGGSSRYGSFAFFDLSVVRCNNDWATVVVNAQARKDYWRLSNHVRNKTKGWYDESLNIIREASKKAGVDTVLIPSNEVIRKTISDEWSHKVPDTILNQYYDGFSVKRNYSVERVSLLHPVNSCTVEGEFWRMN